MLASMCAFEHVPQILARSCGSAIIGFPSSALVKKRLNSVILNSTRSTLPSLTLTSSWAEPSTFVSSSSFKSNVCINLCGPSFQFSDERINRSKKYRRLNGASGNFRVYVYDIPYLLNFWQSRKARDKKFNFLLLLGGKIISL